MVIKFPLMSSTTLPVETKLVDTVFMFVVKVCPVVTRLEAFVLVSVLSSPVAANKAAISASLSVISPDTVFISVVNV